MSTTPSVPQRVLITGGASGIGAAIAQRCEADGYKPNIWTAPGNAIHCDLSDPVSRKQHLIALADGPITRLVNNGSSFPNTVSDQTIEFDAAIALNLRSAFCALALLPGMRAAGLGARFNVIACSTGKELRSACPPGRTQGMTRTWALEKATMGSQSMP